MGILDPIEVGVLHHVNDVNRNEIFHSGIEFILGDHVQGIGSGVAFEVKGNPSSKGSVRIQGKALSQVGTADGEAPFEGKVFVDLLDFFLGQGGFEGNDLGNISVIKIGTGGAYLPLIDLGEAGFVGIGSKRISVKVNHVTHVIIKPMSPRPKDLLGITCNSGIQIVSVLRKGVSSTSTISKMSSSIAAVPT